MPVAVPLPSGSLQLVSLSLRNYESPFEHLDPLRQAKEIRDTIHRHI